MLVSGGHFNRVGFFAAAAASVAVIRLLSLVLGILIIGAILILVLVPRPISEHC